MARRELTTIYTEIKLRASAAFTSQALRRILKYDATHIEPLDRNFTRAMRYVCTAREDESRKSDTTLRLRAEPFSRHSPSFDVSRTFYERSPSSR